VVGGGVRDFCAYSRNWHVVSATFKTNIKKC
jgi:hypothetical protein